VHPRRGRHFRRQSGTDVAAALRAIAQLPGWSAGFSVTGSHTIFNVFAWLTAAGQFYFDKTTGTLYYYPARARI